MYAIKRSKYGKIQGSSSKEKENNTVKAGMLRHDQQVPELLSISSTIKAQDMLNRQHIVSAFTEWSFEPAVGRVELVPSGLHNIPIST